MNLTDHQRAILTLLDEHPVASAITFVQKTIPLSEEEISKIISILLHQELLEISKLPEKECYLQSVKVTKDMLNLSLAKKYDTPAYHRYWSEIQQKNPEHIASATTNLEKKLHK